MVTAAVFNDDLPTRQQLQSQLDMLNKQSGLSQTDKLDQQDRLKTLSFLDEIEQIKESTKQLKQQVTQAPARLTQAINDLQALKKTTDTHAEEQAFSTLKVTQLEARMNTVLERLESAQNDLSSYSSQLINLQTQPENIQASMYVTAQRIQILRGELQGSSLVDNSLRDAQQEMMQTELSLLNQKMAFQRKQLEANTTLQDLLQKQRDYTSAYIKQQEYLVQILQNVINHKRLTLSEETVKKAQNTDIDAIKNHPLVSQALISNRDLSQKLLTSTENINLLIQENIRVKNSLDRMQQTERNLKEQISVLKGTILLSRILYQQQQSMPDTSSAANVGNRIADLRLEQFTISQQRDVLYQGSTYVAQLGLNSKEPVAQPISTVLSELVEIRRELLDRLNRQLGEELRLSINLQINQQQLLHVNDSLQTTLKQQIFWVNSNKPIDLAWLKAAPERVTAEFSRLNYPWSWPEFRDGIFESALPLSLLFVLIVLFLAGRKRINRTLNKLANETGILHKDSQYHTPLALLLTTLKTVPGVLLILAAGLCFSRTESTSSALLWALSQRLALGWFAMMFMYHLLAKGGIFDIHFQIKSSSVHYYRRRVIGLFLAMLPLIVWSAIGEKYPLWLVDDVFGQIIVILTLLILAVLLFPVWLDAWRHREAHSGRLLTVTLVTLIPLVLLFLMLAGYFYTTLKLARHWIDSLYLVMAWEVVYAAVVRALAVAARRLAYRRALAKRRTVVREDAEGNELSEETPLALDQINQQTLRLMTMTLLVLFAFLFFGIWSDVFTVFSYLDSVSLWNYSTMVAGSDVVKDVTLGSLLFAIALLAATYVITRNLSGLLEVLILSKLQLRQGTSYAFTTILSYLLTAIGVVSSLAVLGVSWDKLQWLVAALSLGLGFGMQEIFANFVSGLIILFERPVRIGDTITIGTYSGSVSKIRIRATTIIDFDRKEVIVPNKAFVTERLINWTLSDTTTRILINLGVAYGSDLDKVKKILLTAARENPRVMSDPEPQVLFLKFGASTLEHELRLYVRELRDRSYTVDELNRRIDQLCRENNIEIAFNQLSVHLHNQQGKTHSHFSKEKTQTD